MMVEGGSAGAATVAVGEASWEIVGWERNCDGGLESLDDDLMLARGRQVRAKTRDAVLMGPRSTEAVHRLRGIE